MPIWSSSAYPRIELSGVRNSWLMTAQEFAFQSVDLTQALGHLLERLKDSAFRKPTAIWPASVASTSISDASNRPGLPASTSKDPNHLVTRDHRDNNLEQVFR